MKLTQSIIMRISFALFLGWIMSLPYEGPVLYGLADQLGFNGTMMNNATVAAHFSGILLAAFFVKNSVMAKQIMLYSSLTCFIGSFALIFASPNIWHLLIVPISFIAGTYVTSWAFFYKLCSIPKDRGKVSADVLILANIVLTIAAFLSMKVSGYWGFFFILSMLLLSFYFTLRLETGPKASMDSSTSVRTSISLQRSLYHPMLVFYFFIFLITLTSGTMFSVVYPYFGEFETLSSVYTNIPYMLGLLIMRLFTTRENKAYTLYMGMFFLGISYIGFFLLPKTVISFFLIMTPLLFAYGVFDFFWWRIMGDLFEYTRNPSKVLGLGLGTNVFGVWCGGLIGQTIMHKSQGDHLLVSAFSIGILFVVLLLLPILNHQMSKLLSNHAFFRFFSSLSMPKQDSVFESYTLTSELSEREKEIVTFVLKGCTYKQISTELFISENTVKTHIKNIYRKLEINSKYQLIQLFGTDSQTEAYPN